MLHLAYFYTLYFHGTIKHKNKLSYYEALNILTNTKNKILKR